MEQKVREIGTTDASQPIQHNYIHSKIQRKDHLQKQIQNTKACHRLFYYKVESDFHWNQHQSEIQTDFTTKRNIWK